LAQPTATATDRPTEATTTTSKRGRPKKTTQPATKTKTGRSKKKAVPGPNQAAQALQQVMDYFNQCPLERQPKLFMLHSIIQGGFPNVSMSIKENIPTYEHDGHWVALANLKNYVSLYVSDSTSLSEFTAKYPHIKAGKSCLNFVDSDVIPMQDIQAVVQKALNPVE
jgi:hypothetical protein